MEETIESILKNFPPNRKENLVPILQSIQSQNGFLSDASLQKVGKYLNVPINKIFGVATFYDQFRFKPDREKQPEIKRKVINPLILSSAEKSFLLEKIMKNMADDVRKEDQENLLILRKEKVTRPVIFIGTGSCGLGSGAEETLDAIKTFVSSNNADVEIVEVGCIGLCSEEPIMDVQLPGKSRISFKQVTADKVPDILNSIFNKTVNFENVLGQYRNTRNEVWSNVPYIEQLPWFALQQRDLLKNTGMISPISISDYLVRGGYRSLYKTVLNYIPSKVCDIIEQSELRGRGGAGYFTGKKWKLALTTAGDEKYLICNADESDPGAFMDRAIIEGDPHRLLEGIAIAAYAIGANNAYIYIRTNHPRTVELLEEALRQAKEHEILGQNIFGSGFNLTIHIHQGAGAFICGEETALINSLEGKRGLPRAKPPYPAETGLFGKPTVVNNVETLVNVPAIIEKGPSWFKNTGSKNSKGTKIFSLKGNIKRSGFIEIPMGIKLRDIIYQIGGGPANNKTIKAVLVGGPMGVFIPDSELDIEIGYESMDQFQVVLGSGGLNVLDENTCIVNHSLLFMEFLQNESCGKCIPCREGSKRMFEILESITKRPKEETSHETLERFKGVVQLENLARVIQQTSLCGLGQKAPNLIISSLKWFREEFEEHIFDRRCPAGECRYLRTFHIDVETCNGCNVCQRKCPENAIIGVIKYPHFIVEDKCNGCGICFESCKFNAIVIK
jgi:NADH:ubiquinone oxidoreductase subunit F (NADH-binding)/NADH:ubiquinone oxidoreductase subunit E/Pyruvate/2-oxoacid:ferredoxin oxidoreductase delta subunit